MELYLAFVAATTVMILLSGPSVMLTVAHSLSFGASRAPATVSGAVLAIGVQLVTLIGMSWMMLVLADGFELLRWACVAYLIFLGVQQRVRLRNRIAGSLMIGAGLGLALVRRT